MSSILPFIISTAVPGVVSGVLGYELFNKFKIHPFERRDAGLLLGGMVLSACLTHAFKHIAENELKKREMDISVWKIKITGLGITQVSGYTTGFFFQLLKPYLNRINPVFSFGYCIVQLGANAYTLYKFYKEPKI